MTSHLTENQVVLGDNLELLKQLPDESFQLIYIDPPFNTGKKQSMARQTTVAGEVVKGDSFSYEDAFDGDSFLEFIQPRLKEAHRLLKPSGTIYIHLDYREVHYVKVMADTIFGRQNFLNEIIWSYDYGGKAKNKWPAKHDNILVYVKDIKKYAFDSSTVDRIPYMAPGLAGPEKAALGKRVTDSWFITIAPTQGPERTGYPTQKPVKLLQRIIKASSVEGDWVLDFFAGSGTTAAVAGELGRRFVTVDQNPESFKVVQARLTKASIPFVATEL